MTFYYIAIYLIHSKMNFLMVFLVLTVKSSSTVTKRIFGNYDDHSQGRLTKWSIEPHILTIAYDSYDMRFKIKPFRRPSWTYCWNGRSIVGLHGIGIRRWMYQQVYELQLFRLKHYSFSKLFKIFDLSDETSKLR